jgi:hypothetical protein
VRLFALIVAELPIDESNTLLDLLSAYPEALNCDSADRMGLTLQDIFDCESGYRNPIIVGELPNALRVHLGLRVPQVHLSRESLGHIKARHPDIDNFDLCFLPLVIERGAIMQERAKPQVIVSAYKDTESHRQYAAT